MERDAGGDNPRTPQPGAPLSPAQRRFWLLHEWDRNKTLANIPLAFRLEGDLDIGALERSISRLALRHEAFRTGFRSAGAEPTQEVEPGAGDVFRQFEFSGETDPDAAAFEWLRRDARQPFDLSHPPLIRFSLLRLGDRRHVLALVAHHIVIDGWSFDVLVPELTLLYESERKGEPARLPPLPITYVDYSIRECEWAHGTAHDEQLTYWTGRLAGLAPLDLPSDRSRPATPTYETASVPLALSGATAEALRRMSRRERLTLPMVFTTAFQILLARYCGQTDIAVGIAVANRSDVDVEGLIGLFANTLVIRLDLSGRLTARAALRHAREVSLDAYRHARLPFDELAAALARDRAPGQQSMIRAIVLVGPALGLSWPGLKVCPLPSVPESAQFDLSVGWADGGSKLTGIIRYSTELFDRWRVEQLGRHYVRLLDAIAVDVDQPIASIDLLEPSERRTFLGTSSLGAESEAPLIVELFERQADKTPHAPAVVFGGTSLSYAELNERANRLARHLIAAGLGTERIVGVALPRAANTITAVLGIFKAGAVYLPLDPDLPPRRLASIIEDAQPATVLTTADVQPRLPSTATIMLDEVLDAVPARVEHTIARRCVPNPSDAAYLMYTSGSTGRPKGVVVEQGALAAFLLAMREHLTVGPGERHLAVTTTSFDISMLELVLPLCDGGAVVMAGTDDVHDVTALAALIRAQRPTSLQATPTYWRMLIQHEAACLNGLRILVGGEALPADVAADLRRLGAGVCNLYGPTEATIWASILPDLEWDASDASGIVGIGRPLLGYQLYVLDAEDGFVPVGVAGQLYIAGPGLARGYLNRPGLTAACFRADPHGPAGSRMYRTGDYARWRPNGTLEFLGRRDDQIKIRGLRVELGEIEATLRKHDAVSDAVVTDTGEGHEKQLLGYVIAAPRASDDDLEPVLRDYLRQQLPAHMVPARIVPLAAWPTTATGKLDRRALPVPAAITAAVRPPQTPCEQLVCTICREALGVPAVGLDDSFFALGGESLMVMRVIARIHEAVQISVPFHLFFDLPTIGELASWIETQTSVGHVLNGNSRVHQTNSRNG